MMKKIVIFMLISFNKPYLLIAQNVKHKTILNVNEVFNNFERKLNQVKKENKSKKIFTSPVDDAMLFERTLKKETPFLSDSTNMIVDELLGIILDEGRDKSLSFDVVRVLYHLCIDDYIDAVSRIYEGYRLGKVKVEVVIYCIITYDNHFSNIIVNNYCSVLAQKLFSNLLGNSVFLQEANQKRQNFTQNLLDIKSGAFYNAFQKEEPDWIFVIEPKNCQPDILCK
jgi:hypothetical protein